MKKLLAGATAVAMLVPGLAFASVNSSTIRIETTNQGSIDSTVTARSHTGDNFAGGSFGGDGDNGGSVTSAGGDNNNGDAGAGNGGNGGNAGVGGTVQTGNADASAGSFNALNSTAVDMDLGGEDLNSSDVRVISDNDDVDNNITDDTTARARSGENFAGGSFGGDGDNGGTVSSGSGDNNNGSATGGQGGAGGAADAAGLVHTGAATSEAGSVNVLNTALVRVRI